MIFLGHLGFTTAAFKAYGKINKNIEASINYNYVYVGAVLPDLIDKPTEYILRFLSTKKINVSGRLYAHTLFFSIIIILLGAAFYYLRNNVNVLTLGFASLLHTQLDLMWLFPKTFFYPLTGAAMPMIMKHISMFRYYRFYFTIPFLLLWEAIGLILLIILRKPEGKLDRLINFVLT